MKIKESDWINRGTDPEPSFGIHEIYLKIKKEGDISWTINPLTLDKYDNLDHLIHGLEMILNDAKKFAPL